MIDLRERDRIDEGALRQLIRAVMVNTAALAQRAAGKKRAPIPAKPPDAAAAMHHAKGPQLRAALRFHR